MRVSEVKRQQRGKVVDWEKEMWRVTLRSVKVVNEYVERVIKPQTGVIDDMFERNLVV